MVGPASPSPAPQPLPSHPAHPAQRSNFTRILYAIAMVLGAVTLVARITRGAQGGGVDWIELALPTAVMLGLTGVMIGPRRPALYYPVLLAGAALLVSFYVTPRHARRAAPPSAPAPSAAAPAGAR